MKRLLLADLSNNNPHVQLNRIHGAGVIGFWHKVSEGQHFTDAFWFSRHRNAQEIGLRVGGYHFAHASSLATASTEAHHFVKSLGAIQRRDLAPVLDLESSASVPVQHLDSWARIWMHTVHELTGIWSLFYSYPDFVRRMNPPRVIGRGLWLASYSRNDGTEHPYLVPAPFRKALAHQFTSQARLPGVSGVCDLSSAPKLYPLLAHGLRGL